MLYDFSEDGIFRCPRCKGHYIHIRKVGVINGLKFKSPLSHRGRDIVITEMYCEFCSEQFFRFEQVHKGELKYGYYVTNELDESNINWLKVHEDD